MFQGEKGEKTMQIHKHYQGYWEARKRIANQTLEEDLDLIDNLFGRGTLCYGATPEQVKAEALRQLEIEWRMPNKRR